MIAFTAIGQLLLRQPFSKDARALGSRVLHACSEAREPNAVIGVVKIAHRRGLLKHEHFRSPLAGLTQMAREKHPRAMVLMAQILEDQNKVREALKLYQEAIEQSAKSKAVKGGEEELDDDQLDPITGTEDPTDYAVDTAWTAMGALHARLNDPEKAVASFKEGAFQGDDPEAYHALAQFEIQDPDKPIYTAKYIEYETKAAASGHIEAAFALAKFYSMDADEAAQKTTRKALRLFQVAGRFSEGRRLTYAFEWARLAAEPPPVFPEAVILALDLSVRSGNLRIINIIVREIIGPNKREFSSKQLQQAEQILKKLGANLQIGMEEIEAPRSGRFISKIVSNMRGR